MHLQALQPGDAVTAAVDIDNDGSHPEHGEASLIAAAGTRGMLVKIGHLEEDNDRLIYLVCFERSGADGGTELGPPVGCWAEEIQACLS